jgi:hypothetical protein
LCPNCSLMNRVPCSLHHLALLLLLLLWVAIRGLLVSFTAVTAAPLALQVNSHVGCLLACCRAH